MKEILSACIAITLSVCLGVVTAPSASAQSGARPDQDAGSAIVVLKGEPLSTYAPAHPPPGKKIDFNSNTVKSYRARLSALRNDFKAWLRVNAPSAQLTGQFDLAINAVAVELNGTTLETLKQAPQVQDAQYEGLYYPTVGDPDLGLIQAMAAWELGGGPANAGENVKVAILDTGIDINHPCFSDAGYPAQKQLGDRRFTNNKVIAAKVFNIHTVIAGYTPAAVQEHGTHVAGTVGCNYNTPAVVEGVAIPYGVSGVAPRVLLGNYNIFPANVTSARSESIFQALEEAYEDGFDVANMSLGGGARGEQDLVAAAVNRLDMANMVVAVAAGNSGPGYLTVESPGTAARALTAGASTVPHFMATPVALEGHVYAALSGNFATVPSDLTAPLGVVLDGTALGQACGALAPGSLAGKIALISRGTCSFSAKIRNAQAAGAVAVLMVNNVVGDPIPMGQDGTPNQPTIPAYMLGVADAAVFKAADGAAVTISASVAYFQTPNADIMASFSSWGPTPVDFRIKPDVVAPGVNVLSSIPNAYCGGNPCWAFFQGTSMATPHLAGSAAVVRWLYPDWSAAEVRSAIVNTANRTVLKNYVNGAPFRDVNAVGAGREDLLAAVNASVALDPVSVSFGAVPSGSGQEQPFAVTLKNLRNASAAYTLAITSGDASVAYSVAPASVSLQPGESTTLTVTMNAIKGAAGGGHQATLTVSSGGAEVGHAAVYTLIK